MLTTSLDSISRGLAATLTSTEGGTSPSHDLSAVWHQLKAGTLRIGAWSTSCSHVHLELHETRVTDATVRPSALDATIAERILRGEQQKVVASELGLAASVISKRAWRFLQSVGLRCKLSELPAGLILLAQRSDQPARGVAEASERLGHRRVSFERPVARLAALTPAERQVVDLMIEGLTARAIAKQRASSQRTVANQIAQVYSKLRVSRRIELIGHLLAA